MPAMHRGFFLCTALALGCSPPAMQPVEVTKAATPLPSTASAAPTPPSEAPDPATPQDQTEIARLARLPPEVFEQTPRFAPDGKGLVFASNFEGRPALYRKELAGSAPPRKVADLTGAFRRPQFSSDGAHLYFTADTAADETYKIKRISLANGALEDVATTDKLKHDGPWPSTEGRLVFTARHIRESGTVLFELVPGDKPRQLFADPKMNVAAVRADGKQVLLVRAPLEDALFVLDLGAGAADASAPRRIYPDSERRVQIHDVTYAPDGKRIFIASDDGTEKLHLLSLDARGRVLRRHTDSAGGTAHALTAKADRVAWVIDRGTHQEVRVHDATTLKPLPTPSLPLGSEVPAARHPTRTHGLSLSPDGRRLAVQWSTPSTPPRIHLVETQTGKTMPLGAAGPSNLPAVGVEVVRIRSFDGLEVPTIVYGANGATKRPVVMSIHGAFPAAATVRNDAFLSALVAAGHVVVEPNVRGSGGFGGAFERADNGAKKLDAVRDFRAVGTWIAAQPWADPARMAVTGPSAGGYYTLMCLAHQPDLWRAGLALVPVFDAEATMRATEGDLRLFWEEEMAPLSEPATLAAISPSSYVARVRAPVFLYAGSRDVRAPVSQLAGLVRDLRGRGLRAEYMLSEQGHSRTDPRTVAELTVRMLRFLREELEPAPVR